MFIYFFYIESQKEKKSLNITNIQIILLYCQLGLLVLLCLI